METANLTNHFLIAMPGLNDPNFYHTVTYVCAHNEEGAMGIVVNRPLEIRLGELLDHMDIGIHHEPARHLPVFQGGPVEPERGFVLHRPNGGWHSMMTVDGQVAITTSRDILSAIAHGSGPHKNLVALGYAGWRAGQLEAEMVENAWLSGPADASILFDVPAAERWSAAANLLGVDMRLMSMEAGHG